MKELRAGFLKLNWQDWVNGLSTAIFTAVIPVLYQATQQGMDLLHYDWASVGKLALSAGFGYILRKFLTTEDGHVMGVVKA